MDTSSKWIMPLPPLLLFHLCQLYALASLSNTCLYACMPPPVLLSLSSYLLSSPLPSCLVPSPQSIQEEEGEEERKKKMPGSSCRCFYGPLHFWNFSHKAWRTTRGNACMCAGKRRRASADMSLPVSTLSRRSSLNLARVSPAPRPLGYVLLWAVSELMVHVHTHTPADFFFFFFLMSLVDVRSNKTRHRNSDCWCFRGEKKNLKQTKKSAFCLRSLQWSLLPVWEIHLCGILPVLWKWVTNTAHPHGFVCLSSSLQTQGDTMESRSPF